MKKNYYCVVIIGDYKNIEQILTPLISGLYNNLLLSELFICTFESDADIMDIESQLMKHKKSYILNIMDENNFGAIIQDRKAQKHLFADYLRKGYETDEIKHDNELPSVDDSIPIFFEKDLDEDQEEFNRWVQQCANDENFGSKNDKIKLKMTKQKPKILTLDEILDKITRCGYNNLTADEKTLLNKYSQE